MFYYIRISSPFQDITIIKLLIPILYLSYANSKYSHNYYR